MNKISWWRTTFGEEEAQSVAESIKHECISQGVVTVEFEQALANELGIPYVVATTSGSMAILMALIAAGVGPGDEVIVPNRTWIATAHAPLLLGAKVVLVDVEAELPIMDVAKIEEKITSRTKIIIPVHLNGRSADMRSINQIALKHGLKVIEDSAQAFYSRNVDGMLGCQSFAGCFSLSVAKLISSGQGGFVVTKDKEIYRRLKSIRTHGVDDLINVSYTQMGFNFRFTDIQASIAIVQLRRLLVKIARVKTIYEKYLANIDKFPFLKLIPVDISFGEIPIYCEVLVPERKRLIEYLSSNNIQTRPFYPDLNSAFYLGCKGEFPNSRIFAEQGLFLPCGPGQPLDNVDQVIEVLRSYKGKTCLVKNSKSRGSSHEEIFLAEDVRSLGLEYENKVVKTLNKTGYMRNFLSEIGKKFSDQDFSQQDSILEIGFGIGAALCGVIRRGAKNIVAVDSEAKHLDIASVLLGPILNAHLDTKLTLLCDSLPKLSELGSNSFDSILCAETLHFMKPDEFGGALGRLHQLLKLGGKLYVNVGSPYAEVYKGFGEEYDRRRTAGDKFPGFMENVRKYHPQGLNHNLGFFLFFDPTILRERFEEAGFKVLESCYIDVAENNRGITGLIAMKE